MKIRCCVMDGKTKYRGIDREVELDIFRKEKDKKAWLNAFEQDLRYNACEEEYTSENLRVMSEYVDFVKPYASCEIILYSKHPVAEPQNISFLGIDVVDPHLKSVLNWRKPRFSAEQINSYGLFDSEQDASSFISKMENLSPKYVGLYAVFVYRMGIQ